MFGGSEAKWTVRVLVGRVEGELSGPDPLAKCFDRAIADEPKAVPTFLSTSQAQGCDCEESEVVARFVVAADTWRQASDLAESIRQRAVASVRGVEAQGWTMSVELAPIEPDDSHYSA